MLQKIVVLHHQVLDKNMLKKFSQYSDTHHQNLCVIYEKVEKIPFMGRGMNVHVSPSSTNLEKIAKTIQSKLTKQYGDLDDSTLQDLMRGYVLENSSNIIFWDGSENLAMHRPVVSNYYDEDYDINRAFYVGFVNGKFSFTAYRPNSNEIKTLKIRYKGVPLRGLFSYKS